MVGEAIAELKDLATEHGFTPVIVAFPIPTAMSQPFPDARYIQELQAICDTHGIPVLDLEPAFRSEYDGHESLYIPYDADHPNARGHDVAAAALTRFLLDGELLGTVETSPEASASQNSS